ncbi:MAG: methionine aminotransferase [Bacteroidales bacterium]|jgi:methionine transaminase
MTQFPSIIHSKLPGIGTSIFAVMSQLASEYHAINLSQGFPDFEVSAELIEKIGQFMRKGYNQYAPMPGVPALRQAIVRKARETYGIDYDADKEVTVTAGATQAIYTAVSAIVREGDEVIILEPAYDSYAPAVKMNGGMVKYSPLKIPGYGIDWELTTRLVTSRTRMIIINSPHNPTGSVLTEEDLKKLEDFAGRHNLVVVSDEVYEHLIYDGLAHQSVCLYPKLAARSYVIGSFGKTFHATGWKMGYALAPENLTEEFRKVHQFIVFTCNTPIQHALAEYMEDKGNYSGLNMFYQQKRDYFADLMQDSRFRIVPCYGTYFQLLDYSAISDEPERDFAIRLTKEYGVATIPISPFYQKEFNNSILRVCFAKKEATLKKAADILCKI